MEWERVGLHREQEAHFEDELELWLTWKGQRGIRIDSIKELTRKVSQQLCLLQADISRRLDINNRSEKWGPQQVIIKIPPPYI